MNNHLLNKKQVIECVGYSGQHIGRLERDGLFPKRVNPSGKPQGRKFWSKEEIENWVQAQLAARAQPSADAR